MLENYPNKIGVANLAKMVGLSVSQFERKFKEQLKITPTEFITLARLNAAKTLLAQSAESLGDVAHQCGFYDQSQFNRLFKREPGITPKECRKFFR